MFSPAERLCAPSRSSKRCSWRLPAERGAKIIAPAAVGQRELPGTAGVPSSAARQRLQPQVVTRSFLTLIFGGASYCLLLPIAFYCISCALTATGSGFVVSAILPLRPPRRSLDSCPYSVPFVFYALFTRAPSQPAACAAPPLRQPRCSRSQPHHLHHRQSTGCCCTRRKLPIWHPTAPMTRSPRTRSWRP